MFVLSQQHLNQQHAADVARVAVLRREIGMLRQAQSHLSGIPARHNLLRIAERQDLLATLDALVALGPECMEG